MEPMVTAGPFLKWPGGKRKLADRILAAFGPIPAGAHYVEPFVGGGAVFFALRAKVPSVRAWLSDANGELIHLYQTVRDQPYDLIAELRRPFYRYDESRYYEIRATPPLGIQRAARTVYLNKCGFNGVFRVNKDGQFNVPFGRHSTPPTICDSDTLLAAADALRGTTIHRLDYTDAFKGCSPGSFVYCDPPYVPIAEGSFTAYTGDDFGEPEQHHLATQACALVNRGVRVVLSNSDTPLVHALYPDAFFERIPIQAARSVSRTGDRRAAAELLIVGRQ